MDTSQNPARPRRAAYSICPLPAGYPFHPYAEFDHGGQPQGDGLGDPVPAPTEQQWLELNRLAPLAAAAGFRVTLTQLHDGPLRLTTTPLGQAADEVGLQWCDAEPFKAYHRAGHYLRGKAQRPDRRTGGATLIGLSPAQYVAWIEEHLEPWQAWSRLLEWEAASQYPDYCFALRQHLGAGPEPTQWQQQA